MFLKTVSLTDFRNFSNEVVHLRSRVNFFVGENGQGKTNLLEAVYLLSRGQSFRPTTSESLIRKDVSVASWETSSIFPQSFSQASLMGPSGEIFVDPGISHRRTKVVGVFEKGDLDFRSELLIENGRKNISINGKKTSSSRLFGLFPTILFSPESLAAIKEGPEQRRLLIDDLMIMVNPQNFKLLQEFTKCLRARNKILRGLANSYGDFQEQEAVLESLNKIYFLLSTHLMAARIHAIHLIKDFFRDAMNFISDHVSGGNSGDISVDYLISEQSALNWSEQQMFDALRNRHLELTRQEIASGSSLVGPHKHDIKFIFAGNDSRFYCSQGQQRALILALKIAQIVYYNEVHQTYPVLLLDDVLSELDTKKRVNLLTFLESISAQVLITATDLTWPEHLERERNGIFSVTAGHIAPA